MTFIWGVNFVVAKIALRSFPALLFAPLRALFAAFFLIPAFFWYRSRSRTIEEPWTRRDLITLILLGIAGIALNQVFFITGMEATSVAHAALVISMTPVLVLSLAAVRGQESFTGRKIAGMGIAIAGVAALQVVPGRAQGASVFGDFLIFLAALAFALFTVFGKEVTSRHSAITVNTVGYAAGAAAGLPLLAWQANGFDFTRVSASGWLTLIYMALFPSVLCYLIFYHALRRIDASRVAAFSYAQPVIASVADLLILSEPLTVPIAVGGLLVLSGVWLTSRR